MSDFEGSTLALQHYYDVAEVSRRLPMMTLYRANEQPFGTKMAVWMATPPREAPFPKQIRERLESELLKNRAINTPSSPRILDFGSGDGNGFVVTDELVGDPLATWFKSNGPLHPWQLLRLTEQLVNVVEAAHRADMHFLGLTTQNVFVVDEERFGIRTAPLGMCLHRQELRHLQDVSIVPNLVRHVPAWEFNDVVPPTQPDSEEGNEESGTTTADEAEAADRAPSEFVEHTSSGSIQNLDLFAQNEDAEDNAFELKDLTPDGLDADVYAVAAILYEAVCGQHPYFGDGREVCDAVFTMTRSEAKALTSKFDMPDSICKAITELVKVPKAGALNGLLSLIHAQLNESERVKALHAEKAYLDAPAFEPLKAKPQKVGFHIPHPRLVTALLACILLIGTAAITHHFSSQRHPVDLFALPELLPAVSEGVDLVLPQPADHPDLKLYLTNLADGSLIPLGQLPFIYRNQPTSAKINFVLMDERGKTTQLPVLTNSEPGLQIVTPVF